MMRGYETPRYLRERVWRLVHEGHRRFSDLSERTGLPAITVRDIVLDACVELVPRLDRERRNGYIDDLRERE